MPTACILPVAARKRERPKNKYTKISDTYAAYSHCAARIGGFFTFGSAFLTMIVLEFGAPDGTLFANGRTKLANLQRVLRIGRHQADGFFADACALHHHSNVILAGGHVRLAETEFDALVASLGTPVTFVDAGLIFVRKITYNAHLNTHLYIFSYHALNIGRYSELEAVN